MGFLICVRSGRNEQSKKLLDIPALRILSLRDGMTRPFANYRAGDPFVLREFCQKIHEFVQNEMCLDNHLFPRQQSLSETLRQPLDEHILDGFAFGHTSTSESPGSAPGLWAVIALLDMVRWAA